MPQARFIQEPGAVDYTPGSAVTGGAVVELGTRVLVAKTDIAANVLGALASVGLFAVAKVTGAITVGTAVYWDNDGDPLGGTVGTGAATTTAAGNNYMGYCVLAAAEADTTVNIVLGIPTAVSLTNQLANVVADPGDAGAIPVTIGGTCPIVTTGAETRTLAAPTFVGELLCLNMKTDGGDAVVTCATTINETGNNTITFANTGEMVLLLAVEEGSTKRWRVVVADGAALSTV